MKKWLVISFFFPVLINAQSPTLMLPRGHMSPVINSCFIQNGKYLLTASSDGTVKMWETASGYVIKNISAYTTAIEAFEVNLQSGIFLTLSKGAVKIWDINSFHLLSSFFDPEDKIEEAHLSGDGNRLISSAYGKFTVWDIARQRILFESSDSLINSYKDLHMYSLSPIRHISINANGSRAFVQADDKIIFFDINEGEILNAITPFTKDDHPYSVYHIDDWKYIQEENELVVIAETSDKDFMLLTKVFNAATGELKYRYKEGDGRFILNLNDEHSHMFSIIDDSLVVIPYYNYNGFSAGVLNTHTGKIVCKLKGAHRNYITNTKFSKDKKLLLTLSNYQVFVWDIATGMPVDSLQTNHELDNAVFSPDNKYIAASYHTDASTTVWGFGRHIVRLLENHVNNISQIFTTPALDTMSLSLMDMELSGEIKNDKGEEVTDNYKHKVIAADFGGLVYVIPEANFFEAFGLPDNFYSINETYDRKYTIHAEDTLITLRDKDDKEIKVHTSLLVDGWLPDAGWDGMEYEISPDNKLLAVIKNSIYYPYGWDASLFNIEADTMMCTLGNNRIMEIYSDKTDVIKKWVHTDRINKIRFSRDSRYAISSSRDGTVKIWDIKADSIVHNFIIGAEVVDARLFKNGKNLAAVSDDGRITVWNVPQEKLVYTMAMIDSFDYVTLLSDGYYTSRVSRTKDLYYLKNNQPVSFDQLDIRYNRPDKVQQALAAEFGKQDTLETKALYKAYQKRIQKLNIDTTLFRDDYVFPHADILNREAISYDQTAPRLSLHIRGADSNYLLKNCNVWVNGSPVYGQRGFDLLRRHKKDIDTILTINLSQGENLIEAVVTNVNGTESFRLPLITNYRPGEVVKTKMWFIGIGINHFEDSMYNLNYSVKDIRDLAVQLKKKYKADLIIDTLFDKNVTIENIMALKQRLLSSSENDKVIIAYSGHGMLDSSFDYYLSTYNVNFNDPSKNGLSYTNLENLLDSIPARKKLMLIDACQSGEVDKDELIAINEAVKSMKLKKGLKPVAYKNNNLGMGSTIELMQNLFIGKNIGATVISAAAGTQFALERGDLANGVFTFSILEAMKKYSTLKVSQLKTIVGKRVEELTKGLQRPTARNEQRYVDWEVW